MRPYDLEIIQPVYNPFEGWVEKYTMHYTELLILFPGLHMRVILVNDGSQKNFTDSIIKQLRGKIPNIEIVSYKKNKGKGFALRAGMERTSAPYILYTDYDFPYQLRSLKDAYRELLSNSDIVIGIRSADYYKKLSFVRKIISKSFNFFTTAILNIPYLDTQSGLKAFSKKGKELMHTTTINRFLFDTELISKASKDKDLKISTITIELNNDVRFTNINMLIILQEINNLFFISWNLLSGRFNSSKNKDEL
jgi:glycosyltransferase involved in cell wall biosynthesis